METADTCGHAGHVETAGGGTPLPLRHLLSPWTPKVPLRAYSGCNGAESLPPHHPPEHDGRLQVRGGVRAATA